MFIADHLSRAFLPGREDEEFQVFALELEAMNPFDTIKISSERLPQLQKATEQKKLPCHADPQNYHTDWLAREKRRSTSSD